MRRCLLTLALIFAWGTMSGPKAALSQDGEPSKTPELTISAIHVEPAKPAADTLCRLRVEIQNSGDRIGTQLGFTVTVNGQKLPVYENHLFMYPLEPGTTSELALYNFWSTETSRPQPADGKLVIEVTLREARWVDIKTEDGTETWTPVGDVDGLPVSASITVPMSPKAAG